MSCVPFIRHRSATKPSLGEIQSNIIEGEISRESTSWNMLTFPGFRQNPAI